MNPEQNVEHLISPPLLKRVSRKIQSGATSVFNNRLAWFILLAALTMTILEGAFRKWVSPFQGGVWKYLMYFSKDIIFALLLFLPRRSASSPALKVFEAWLVPGCVLVALGAGLSCLHGFNLVGAILTSRATMILPLLALLAVPRLAGLPLRWILWLAVAFTVINFALGVEQNRLPSDHILNRYAADTEDIVAAESGVRATGTFAYIAGMSLISAVGIWAGLTFMSIGKTQWQRIGAWAAITAGLGCGLASVSRAPIVIGSLMIVGWLIVSKDRLSVLMRGLMMGLFCLAIATATGLMPIFSDLAQGLMQRQASSDDNFNNRAFGQLGEIAETLHVAPLGEGFGTHQAGGYFAATGTTDLKTIENPLPRMILETGILGLVGYVAICIGAVLALQTARRYAASAEMRATLVTSQLFLLPMFYTYVIFNHTGSAFAWLIFAAVMAAAELSNTGAAGLEESKRIKRRKQEASPYSVTAGKNS